jgi:antitoxin FitA
MRALLMETAVATLTLRDLDDSLKLSLRIRAASNNRSMEEEARQILRAALEAPAEPAMNLFDSIRSHFEGLGDFVLEIPRREPVRDPPDFRDFVVSKGLRLAAAKPASKPAPQKRKPSATHRARAG